MRVRLSAVPLVVSLTLLLVGACAGGGASPGPSATPAGPTAPPGFAVGSWKTVLTAEDWEGTGIPNVEENTGELVMTFDQNGTWRSVQTSLTGVVLREPIFSGTYTVDGDSLRIVALFPEHYMIEGAGVDVLSWRLEGDLLHLKTTVPADEYTPIIYGAHPWERQ